MSKIGLLGLGMIVMPVMALAGTFAEQCPDIGTCAKVVGELLGEKYVYDADIRGQIKATPNLELTRENAELLFTNALNMNGFARVPLNSETYQIMRQRDARDAALPLVHADAKTPPKLPDNWDLYTLSYKATNADAVEEITRLARSFMPSNSRIIPAEVSGLIMVTDTAPNLKKIYELIRINDVKPSPALKKKWEEREKLGAQVRLLEARRRMAEEGQARGAENPVKPAENVGKASERSSKSAEGQHKAGEPKAAPPAKP